MFSEGETGRRNVIDLPTDTITEEMSGRLEEQQQQRRCCCSQVSLSARKYKLSKPEEGRNMNEWGERGNDATMERRRPRRMGWGEQEISAAAASFPE